MLKEIKFIFIYFGCFTGISMLATKLFDSSSNSGELLGFALWGNIAYAATGFIPWIIINRLSLSVDNSQLRYVIRFVIGLIVMYLLISIANPGSSIHPGVFLGVTIIYILSFVIASIGYTANRSSPLPDEELQSNR